MAVSSWQVPSQREAVQPLAAQVLGPMFLGCPGGLQSWLQGRTIYSTR